MYAVRIVGTFKEVTTRTVVKQEKPYPPMSEAVGGDKELHFKDVEGVIGGFRTPFMKRESRYRAATCTLSTPPAPPAATCWTT